MFEGIYVRKIWSLNPTKFKHILLETAISKYESYIYNFIEAYRSDINKFPKTFQEWLRSEI